MYLSQLLDMIADGVFIVVGIMGMIWLARNWNIKRIHIDHRIHNTGWYKNRDLND